MSSADRGDPVWLITLQQLLSVCPVVLMLGGSAAGSDSFTLLMYLCKDPKINEATQEPETCSGMTAWGEWDTATPRDVSLTAVMVLMFHLHQSVAWKCLWTEEAEERFSVLLETLKKQQTPQFRRRRRWSVNHFCVFLCVQHSFYRICWWEKLIAEEPFVQFKIFKIIKTKYKRWDLKKSQK